MIETERLRLRPFVAADYDWLLEMRADEAVSRYLGGMDDLANRVATRLAYYLDHQARHGYAMSVIALKATGEQVGWGGLQYLDDGDDVEVGYGFARRHWGHGYATEMARGCLAHAFGPLGLDRVVAKASPENTTSTRVMEKIGMRFEKRGVSHGHDIVVYAITKATWLQLAARRA